MGMAASQVRFLSLQNRKNTIGRQLSTLSNRKTSLARDMKNVSRHYTDALNQTNLKWSNDCGANYHNLTYDMLMKPNEVNASVPYILTNANNGKVILNNSALYTPDTMFEDAPETLKAGKAIVIGGQTIANAGDEISYITLAKMISSFKSVDDKGHPVYDTTGAYSTNVEGNLVGQAGIAKGYYIPDTVDFNFKNNLRYDLFKILGLVTDEQVKTQNSMLVELYGSETAKNTGIYPVGSAWGDYYIAQANLDAYEEFLENEHDLSNANTFNGSAKTSVNLSSMSDSYKYATNINGTNGQSTITQTDGGKKGSGSAASHVNFSSVVDKNANGYYEEVSSGSVANSYYDKYRSDYSDNGIQYNITVGKDGVKRTYDIDSILESAINNVNETDPEYIKNNKNLKWLTSGNQDDRKIEIYYGSGEYYFGSNNVYSKIKAPLEGICNEFVALLKKNTITTLDNVALEKAKKQTIWMFANNMQSKYSNECEGGIGNDAKNSSIDQNTAYAARRKIHYHFPFRVHKARIYVAVDTKALMNTMLSYYDHYLNNPNEESSAPTTTDFKTASFDADFENGSVSATAKKTGGKQYLISTVVADELDAEDETKKTGKKIVAKSRAEYSTSASGSPSTQPFYFDASGNNYSESAKDGYTAMYETNNSVTANYYNDFSAISNIYVNEANPSVTIYGMIYRGEDIIYVTNQAAMRKWDSDGTIPTGTDCIVISGSETSGSSYPVTLQDGGTEGVDKDPVILNKTASSTKYGIDTNGKVTEDATYHEKLKQAVVKAQERISELESNLENFYGDADKKIMDYYDALFLRISEQGWEEDNYTKNDLYLNNKIQNNDFFLTECLQKSSNTGFNYTAKQATNVIKIFTVHDDDAENQALAEYEAKKSEIQYKENVIDTRMAKLETEQESINTEMEGIKKVRDDNIQKNFKIFA